MTPIFFCWKIIFWWFCEVYWAVFKSAAKHWCFLLQIISSDNQWLTSSWFFFLFLSVFTIQIFIFDQNSFHLSHLSLSKLTEPIEIMNFKTFNTLKTQIDRQFSTSTSLYFDYKLTRIFKNFNQIRMVI